MFRKELQALINRHSLENQSNTPDFILAEYPDNCLGAFDQAVQQREQWYGHATEPADPAADKINEAIKKARGDLRHGRTIGQD